MKLLPILLSAIALTGCGPDGHSLFSGGPGDIPGKDGGVSQVTSCITPQQGCACEHEGEVVDCGQVERRSGGYVACSMGKRTCKDGAWGTCIADRVSTDISTMATASGLLGLGSSTACLNNPCDPYCVNYIDDGVGLDGGSAFNTKDGDFTLVEGEATVATTTCTGMTVSPTPQTITVTGVSPLVTSPPSLQYNVQLTPPGCASTSVPATWSLSDNDICAIDVSGAFNVYSPVAADVSMTAYVATWQASANAAIRVDIKDESQVPAGTAALFAGSSAAADVDTILYPYDNTVFPRALAAPVIQWDNGGAPADAVKIQLRYPKTGPVKFSWYEIIPETATPSGTIPREIWNAFDQTAKGDDGVFAIQRVVGGVLKQEKVRTVHFSTTPLRGLIYYTEYSRGASTPPPSPAIGGNCSLPTLDATIRALDPTVIAPPVNPFATIAPGGCPVCHSVSANGRMFVTSQRAWGPGGGVSRINTDGTFTQISDAPQPPKPGEDSRGFAFAALTPTGSYALQGSNLWGNTKQLGLTSAGYRPSGGNGEGLQGDYYGTNDLSGPIVFTEVDRTLNFDWGAGSVDGDVPVDNFSVRWTGKVQPYTTESYTFDAEVTDGIRVYVGGNLVIDSWTDKALGHVTSAPIALTAGVKYDIVVEYYSKVGNSTVKLSWCSPTTTSEIIPETEYYPPPQPPSTNGLSATYWDNQDFTGASISRVDPTINFDFGGGSPDPAIGVDTFSARWTGYVKASYTETYTFQTSTDDGVRLWVNGVQLINTWVGQGANGVCPADAAHSGSIALTAGQKYTIKMEYYEGSGGASAKLYWSSPSTACAVVPQNKLFQ